MKYIAVLSNWCPGVLCDVVTPLGEELAGYRLVLTWVEILRLCLYELHIDFITLELLKYTC